MNPFQVVRDFEIALCHYTGAPYAVAVTSCTAALFLCCKYVGVTVANIPRRTYLSVPASIRNAGGKVYFGDEEWRGEYQLMPWNIWDAARRFTSGMYHGGYQCVSFHPSKICGVAGGGAILHDDLVADHWFRKARWHGRTEGIEPKNEKIIMCGWEFRMWPVLAQAALGRLVTLPQHNEDLPNDDYPDLSLTDWNALT